MRIEFVPSNVNLHQALVKDLEARIGTDDISSWIDAEGERLAELGLNTQSWNVEFTDELLRTRNIVAIKSANIGSEARIAAIDGNRYIVTYKQGLPDFAPYYPRRFAIAHEIGHTYWFAPFTSGGPLSPIQKKTGRDHTIEVLCNRFAASLLLPKNRVLRALDLLTKGGSPDHLPLKLIPTLSEYFKVWEKAVAQRVFFYLDERVSAIVCLRPRQADQPLLNSKDSASGWISSWCALPSYTSERSEQRGVRMPITRPKVIPNDMLPEILADSTEFLELDRRWWNSIEFIDSKTSSKPFGSMKSEGRTKKALVCRTKIRTKLGLEDRIYIAL